MGSIGAGELLVIFFAVLLLFGAKRIPEIARGLGQGIREFRSAVRDITSEFQIPEPSPSRVYEPHYARDERLRSAEHDVGFTRTHDADQQGV